MKLFELTGKKEIKRRLWLQIFPEIAFCEGLYVILFKTLVASKLAVALAFARLSDSRRKY